MKLYIETSVPNMLLHDDAPEKKHLANPHKVSLINAVNRQNGRPHMRIHTPKEVIGL